MQGGKSIMPKQTITVSHDYKSSFRADKVIGMFDVPEVKQLTKR